MSSKNRANPDKDLMEEALPLISDALAALLENKPTDGMEFLADFFQSQVKTSVPAIEKKKRKSRNWSVRSLAELNSLIEEEQVGTSTVENLLSKDPEARAKAAVDLLTRQNDSSLIDLIQDYVSS